MNGALNAIINHDAGDSFASADDLLFDSTGDVTLDASGLVYAIHAGSTEPSIIADELEITAGSGIQDFVTSINELTASSNSGDIEINDQDGVNRRNGGLTLNDISTSSGDIDIATDGGISLGFLDGASPVVNHLPVGETPWK